MDGQVIKMVEVARRAGVSQTAVSAVINNRRGTIRLSEATRRRIEQVIQELGYCRNVVGRGLVVGRSFLIGVIADDVASSFVPQAIQGIEDVAVRQGVGVLLMTTRRELDRERRCMEFLRERSLDGVIIAESAAMQDAECWRALRAMQLPTVYLFYRPKSMLRRERSVRVSADRVGELAIGHLIERGHRHVVCVSGGVCCSRRVVAAMKRSCDGLRVEMWDAGRDDAGIERTLERWQSSRVRPTAMFVGSGDEVACRILNVAIRRGIRVPQELAIVGVDDIPQAASAVVRLTTVSQPKYEQGAYAAETLFGLIHGESPTVQEMMPTLVVREST